jgi:DNA-binding NtrC family response regulator
MASHVSVLIVDDDAGCLHLLQEILEGLQLRVTTAARPKAALCQMQAEMPDILVTDLRMPEMSGLELVRATLGLARETYCIVITGFASDEVTTEAYRVGVRDLLLKPINVTEVEARMRNAREMVRLRREVRALRAVQATGPADGRVGHIAGRAGELTDLPALPGFAGPVGLPGWDETLHRLKRLAALRRDGVIGEAEFEEKKRLLLERL